MFSNNRFLLNMEEKKILGQLFLKGFDGFDESDRIENFIRRKDRKDEFWYQIFQNLPGVCLKLFVTFGCY